MSGEEHRLFLANLRAPAVGNQKRGDADKPGAFESKDFLRKNAVGKKVKVEVEYTRNIVNEIEGDERTLTFVTVFVGDRNLSELVLESGNANLINPRVDEEFSKYLNALQVAEKSAKDKKIGVHSNKERPVPRYQNMNTPNSFLKDEKKLLGVVEVVINGSRFKVRLQNQNFYIIVVLHGIRCL